MVVDKDLISFDEWLLPGANGVGALIAFIFIIAISALMGVAVSYLISAMRNGPVEGFYRMAQVIVNSVPDFLFISPRRVIAMARLAVQESIRRKILIVFGLFVLLLLFAGWFLDTRSDHPARLYLSFVLTSTNYLILIMALFISTFSLPNDIKARTIYTVVTKPVRPSEIVLGRVAGFAIVCSLMLGLMCLVSYVFVRRGLSHTHTVEMAEVQEETRGKAPDGSDLVFLVGETSFDDHHRHTFEIKPDGEGVTDIQAGHWHTVRKVGESIEVGPPIGDLQARVPVYGKIRFHNRSGTIGEGISVGQEWSYRKYIEGGTLAAAVWTFEDVTPERFPDGLPIELTLRVFRTHKGDMTRSVLGTIHVQNPDASARIRRSAPINFTSKEFQTDEELIPRQLSAIGADGSTVQEIDLFDDLTSDGRIEIWVRCAERAQYFGMAQGDVYLKATEKSFFLNFVRGYGGIWLQMLVVVSFGVMFSTFLSGPIAMLETLSVIVLGFCTQFVTGVFAGVYAANDTLVRLFGTVPGQPDEIKGGGPVESLIRLFTQKNLTVDLDISSVAMNLIRWVDLGLMCLMWFATKILPDFRQFDTSSHVAYGFNISSNLMGQNTLTTFGFVLVLAIVGYYFLKTREIAA